jgi:hypothetical protein
VSICLGKEADDAYAGGEPWCLLDLFRKEFELFRLKCRETAVLLSDQNDRGGFLDPAMIIAPLPN